jgi:hypothetical protein
MEIGKQGHLWGHPGIIPRRFRTGLNGIPAVRAAAEIEPDLHRAMLPRGRRST